MENKELIKEIENNVMNYIWSSKWNGDKTELTYVAGRMSHNISLQFKDVNCGELFGKECETEIFDRRLKEEAEERIDAEHRFELEFEEREKERLLCASRYEFC